MRRAASLTIAVAITMIGALPLGAQTLTGHVTRGTSPITGALVMLIDASGKSVAQTASREEGLYSVTAPAPGSYRAQVLQIGWRPTVVGPFTLRAGGSTTANLDVTGSRIPLDAIVITDRSECRVHPDSAAAAFILWDEARKALIAATMTRMEPLTMSLSRTEQNFDRSGSRVLWDSTRMQVGQSLNPFSSLAPDVLAQRGYMSTDDAGNKTYWGPDASVLLSESFLSSHCIRPERPNTQNADSARLLGVAFSPVSKRRGIVEVDGIVWIDRTTAELRAIDYHYVNTSSVVESAHPGGHIEFLRIPGGRWIVDRWSIGVPSTVTTVRRGEAPTIPGERRVDTPVEELSAIRRTSGLVSEIRRGTDVLWERGRVTLLVRIVDSATGQPTRGVLARVAQSPTATASDSTGTVRIDRVAPGPITLRLESAELELVGRSPILAPIEVPAGNDAIISVAVPSARALVVERCGKGVLDWGEGLLRGTVPQTEALGGKASVVVSWRSTYSRLGGGDAVMVEEKREIATRPDGSFELCGVPRDATVTVRRANDAGQGTTTQFARGALAVHVAIR